MIRMDFMLSRLGPGRPEESADPQMQEPELKKKLKKQTTKKHIHQQRLKNKHLLKQRNQQNKTYTNNVQEPEFGAVVIHREINIRLRSRVKETLLLVVLLSS